MSDAVSTSASQPRLLSTLLALNATAASTLYWAQATAEATAATWGPSALLRLTPSASLAGYAVGVAFLAAFARDLTRPDGLGTHAALLGAGLACAAAAPSPAALLAACAVIGIGCALTQRALVCASGSVPLAGRGPVIGAIVASGLLGIVVARAAVPSAAALVGWRNLFLLDAALVGAIGTLAVRAQRAAFRDPVVPAAQPPSARALWRSEPVLRRAALQQAGVFAAFNAGWAVFPQAVGAGALGSVAAGAVSTAGALAALGAGWLCRRDRARSVARAGCALVAAAAIAGVAGRAVHAAGLASMLLLDVGTQMALVANQARAQACAATPAIRGRLAAIVTTVGFGAGAVGAALGNLVLR